MPSAELAPVPQPEMQELATERFPHFGIPGFERLPRETQDRYLKIPADKLDAARPIIEEKIRANNAEMSLKTNGQTETSQAAAIESTALPRRDQANAAIETYHRAEAGDPQAKKDLLDAKKELLGDEPSDDDIFQTMLEDEGGVIDNSLVLEVALSDTETQQHQDVLDMFKEFRGDLASVDTAIKPKQQIELFIELTKGQGDLAERMFFARKALTVLTASGTRNLSEGLSSLHVLSGDEIISNGVKDLRKMADAPTVVPDQT